MSVIYECDLCNSQSDWESDLTECNGCAEDFCSGCAAPNARNLCRECGEKAEASKTQPKDADPLFYPSVIKDFDITNLAPDPEESWVDEGAA